MDEVGRLVRISISRDSGLLTCAFHLPETYPDSSAPVLELSGAVSKEEAVWAEQELSALYKPGQRSRLLCSHCGADVDARKWLFRAQASQSCTTAFRHYASDSTQSQRHRPPLRCRVARRREMPCASHRCDTVETSRCLCFRNVQMRQLRRVTRQLRPSHSKASETMLRVVSENSLRSMTSSRRWPCVSSAARPSQSVGQHSRRISARTCAACARWSSCGARCCRSTPRSAAQHTTSWRIGSLMRGRSQSCSHAMMTVSQPQAADCCSCLKR